MEEEEPHALEMGEEEAQAAQKEDEKARRRALASVFSDFLILADFLIFLQRSLDMAGRNTRISDRKRFCRTPDRITRTSAHPGT
jgi:hypothetical protein